MINPFRWCAPAVAAIMVGTVAGAVQDAAAPILNHTFEQNDGGWQATGGSGVVSITHDAALVKSGKGALQYAYALKKGEFTLMMLPTPDMVLAKARSFRFWVKADHATSLACSLQEKDGGRYTAIFTTPKASWQHVELSISDFILDQSATAPKDPDGKLDMDQVEMAAIADVSQFFVQGDAANAALFGVSEGPRTLFLDDFTVGPAAVTAGAEVKGGEGSLDSFAHPQIGWMTVGEVELSRFTGKPLEGAGIQAKYHQGPGRITGFMRNVPVGSLAGASKLALSVASSKPAKLVVQVEEKGGGKYNTTIELPGNSGRADLVVKFADFKAADDSKDDNNKLDLDQVVQMILVDPSGLLGQADADNILWINGIKAAK